MSIDYLHEFITLATIHFMAVVIPGPDFVITVRQSIRHGRLAGIVTAIGIGAGISLHVLYTLIGVGALIHATPWLLGTAKIVGGAYIVYLGINMLRSHASPIQSIPELATGDGRAAARVPAQSIRKAFWTGFLTNATNPKATLFFLAIFTTVINPGTPMKIQILFGAWMCMVNALWFVFVSVFFTHPRTRRVFERMGPWFERTMGAVLIVFAGKLMLSL
ncbi:LysE family translocator [Acidihalobacter prosperus]|uniref:Lysine transporter LysE n=1 Tax=Acidihalobacter prosperus TaxID=160660 RepID=A0A1A6C410_9GAMM|nr:LysE family transporter [Acidihalobacter prosperus]OBS09280.1 lysine transporter LysE [Acidihalobacter prosperus]